jgi:transposase-like protein
MLGAILIAALGVFVVSAASEVAAKGLNQGARSEERRDRHADFMSRVAQKLGVTPEQLRQAFRETAQELGIGEAIRERLRQRGPGGREGDGPRFGPRDGERGPGGFGFRRFDGEEGPARGRFGPPGGPAMGPLGRQMESAASAIGIAPQQLREELRGSSLESVALAHGVNPETVANAMIAGARERLDQAVANGRLSQEDADTMLERMSQMVHQLMSREMPDVPALRERIREERGR